MSGKDKHKTKPTEHEYAPFWMYLVFCILLLVTSTFPLFHILDAYPHVYEYQSLARSTLRWMGFVLCISLTIDIYLGHHAKYKYNLILLLGVLVYATLFHDGIGLMIIGLVTLPITLFILPIFLFGLFLMRLINRRIYTWEVVVLLGLMATMSLGVITISWYSSLPYDAIEHKNINDKSYHLMLDSGFLDPTVIKLQKCNNIGLFCESIYVSNDNYDYDDNISWDISEDVNTIIRILVDNKIIHTEIVKNSSE